MKKYGIIAATIIIIVIIHSVLGFGGGAGDVPTTRRRYRPTGGSGI